nr:hypothetical protein [uncultured Roseovarius sp.]
MSQHQLIAIDPHALEALQSEIARLHAKLDAVAMMPKPEWVPVNEFAEMIGKSRRTVLRRIKAGELETREIGGERMVHVSLDGPQVLRR